MPISEKTPPNKYLNHILNRDITTPSGQKLTLMNPAYMIRQVMEYYGKLYGTTGFITSLKVLNPLNKPDDWQRNALKMLEKRGEKEIVGIIQISGETYLKLMRPIFTNEGCLKCHGFQGYQVGDLRGGVGVTVAMAPYLLSEKQTIKNIIKLHLFFWSFGVLFLILFTFWGSGRLTKEKISKKQLQLSNQQLHRALEEINTLRGIIPICSYCKKIRDEEGVWNQLEAYIHSRSEAEFSHGICPECYIREIKEIG